MKQLAVAFAVVVGVLFVGGGVTQAYPPGSATVSVDDSNPPAGGTFTVTVDHCLAGEQVRFNYPGRPSQVVVCTPAFPGASYGSASATFVAGPNGGVFTGTVQLLTSNVTLPYTITVQAPPVVTIPKTGSSGVGRNLSIGMGLLGVGGALLVVAQLRRRTPAAAA